MSNDSSKSGEESFEELDLMIDNMETEAQEAEVKKILDRLPGVRAGRVLQGGAWLSYDAGKTSMEKICAALQKSGYQAGVFQNSNPPVTGTSAE